MCKENTVTWLKMLKAALSRGFQQEEEEKKKNVAARRSILLTVQTAPFLPPYHESFIDSDIYRRLVIKKRFSSAQFREIDF